MTLYSDEIGFLPVDRTIGWVSGQLIPIENLPSIIEEISEEINEDGYIYPPITSRYTANTMDENGKAISSDKWVWKKAPKTRRPSLLHKLPISHRIELETTLVESDFRRGDGAFLLHFIGFLFGVRLQFKDWWHDGRIYLSGRRWVILQETNINSYISNAYNSWSSWPKGERIRFINLLYMNGRSDTYEWDWERFTINYMVFDGCFKMLKELYGWKNIKHFKRFEALFDHFGIQKKMMILTKL